MARFSFASVSLAAKCRLLFGLAVLLIITASLFVPWLRMRDLVHEQNAQFARLAGRLALARIDLLGGNWQLQQEALDDWWPAGSAALGLRAPPPQIVELPDPNDPTPPPNLDPYVQNAIVQLALNPVSNEAPPRVVSEHGLLKYLAVLPIRSTGERHPPGVLLGVVVVEYPAPEARVALIVNLGLSLMAGGLAGILAVLVFYLISDKLILSPVRQLKRVAESVAAGEHSIRSQIATGDEYEALSRAFNAMLSHLESSENELIRINKSLDTKVGELAERNVALFEANKIKSQFLANVSHELRTPLTSIIGFAELLREAATKDGGRPLRYSENIVSSGRMLLGIINDLLDLAKMEAGKLELHLGPVDLKEMAANLMDFMRPLADKKSLQLVANVSEELPLIHSDGGRIQQVLYNLLSNAVKFTPDGGLIELNLRSLGDDGVMIAVRDTGIGIPEDQMSNVFEKFWQLDNSMTREHGGTGLGLAISRDLVQLVGGSLTVESESGKGSTFTVRLPQAAPNVTDPVLIQDVRLT